MNLRLVLLLLASSILSGCSSMMPADTNVEKTFTYDFNLPNQSKNEIWEKARNYFATSFGDSNSVFRVQDKESATLIGKAGAAWYLTTNKCYSEYNISFKAKDNKARLQLELLNGAPAYSECQGYPFPTTAGYEEIKADFNQTANALENAIKAKDAMSDF